MVNTSPLEPTAPHAGGQGDRKASGKTKARMMRHAGRQAHIIATFSSIMVHRVESMSSRRLVSKLALFRGFLAYLQVGSSVFVDELSVVALMMDVMVTLCVIRSGQAIPSVDQHLQSSQCEDQYQGLFLDLGQFARPYQLHWQAQYQDIRSDGIAGIGKPVLG